MPRKTEANMQCHWLGSNENSAWISGFWGCAHLCVSACVCERETETQTEKHRESILRHFVWVGGQAIVFISLKVPLE